MGNFLVSTTLESKITIIKCFIRLTTGPRQGINQLRSRNQWSSYSLTSRKEWKRERTLEVQVSDWVRVSMRRTCIISFFKRPTAASFSFIFGLFKQTIQFLQQINVKKCQVHPVYSTGIWTHDLLNMSCLPATTRPGLLTRTNVILEGIDIPGNLNIRKTSSPRGRYLVTLLPIPSIIEGLTYLPTYLLQIRYTYLVAHSFQSTEHS